MSAPRESPRAAAKRRQIQQAASSLFLSHGFAGTSMDAVSAEAGVSKQTLYVYYRSKEDLLTDVLRQRIERTATGGWPIAESDISLATMDDLRTLLIESAEELLTRLMQPDYLALVRVIIAETTRFPQLGDLFRTTVPERVLESVRARLDAANEQGLVWIDDLDAASRMFVGSLLTWVLIDGLLVTDQRTAPPERERVVSLVDLFLRAIASASS
jgi:TetR/AcrR family transcriptional regulator, mexJK operon transcriptional repressor